MACLAFSVVLTMTVSPSTSSTMTEVFSANRLRLASAGNLVDQLLADPAPHLADAAGGNRDDDAPDLPDEIAARRLSEVACWP